MKTKKIYNLYELNEEQNFAGHIFRKQPKIVCAAINVQCCANAKSTPGMECLFCRQKIKIFRFTFGDNNIEMIQLLYRGV